MPSNTTVTKRFFLPFLFAPFFRRKASDVGDKNINSFSPLFVVLSTSDCYSCDIAKVLDR